MPKIGKVKCTFLFDNSVGDLSKMSLKPEPAATKLIENGVIVSSENLRDYEKFEAKVRFTNNVLISDACKPPPEFVEKEGHLVSLFVGVYVPIIIILITIYIVTLYWFVRLTKKNGVSPNN